MFPDKTPPAGVEIDLKYVRIGDHPFDAKTDKNGFFETEVYAGEEYLFEVSAYYARQKMWKAADSTFRFNKDSPPIILILEPK